MNIKSNISINFYNKNDVYINLENKSNSERENNFAKIAMFSFFTIRTLVNLGKNEASDTLAIKLSHKILNLYPLNIIESLSINPKKKFIAELIWSDKDENLNFTYNAKGFGILGMHVNTYAPNSVIALYNYLENQNKEDNEFLESLKNVAEVCGSLYTGNKLTLYNQGQMAIYVSATSYSIEVES